MPIIKPADLIGRSFLMPAELEDGEHHLARIVEMIKENDDRMTNDSNYVKFKVLSTTTSMKRSSLTMTS